MFCFGFAQCDSRMNDSVQRPFQTNGRRTCFGVLKLAHQRIGLTHIAGMSQHRVEPPKTPVSGNDKLAERQMHTQLVCQFDFGFVV